MNTELLDQLLLDRALGALPPAVEALLDAHLERNEPAAGRARQFAAAADLARRALRAERAPAIPPFPRAALRRVMRRWRQLRVLRNAASLAACLLLGVGLGAWAARQPRLSSPPEGVANRVPPSLATGIDGAAAQPGGFWSRARIYGELRVRAPTRPARIEWHSPISRPSLGGAT